MKNHCQANVGGVPHFFNLRLLAGKFIRLVGCLLFTCLSLLPAPGRAAVVVFDNASNYENSVAGAVFASTGSTPNTFMGDGYLLTPGTTNITGFDIFPVEPLVQAK